MVYWTSGGEIKLMHIARKPTSLGFKLLTMCDGGSKVCLKAELDEGEATHADKKYCDQVQYTTASTLRLVEDYAGSN